MRLNLIFCLSALLGLLISFYLFIQHTRVKLGFQTQSTFCKLGAFADCEKVDASPFSEIAGVPIAALGCLFYFLFLVGWAISRGFPLSRFLHRIFWVLILMGIAADLFLLGVQVFVLRTFCLFCLSTYLFSGLLAAVLWSQRRSFRDESLQQRQWVLGFSGLGSLMLTGILLGLPSWMRVDPTLKKDEIASVLAAWKNEPVRRLELGAGDIIIGNPGAKVQILEFSDFECPHCQKAALILHQFMKSYSDRVAFIFKNFPLDSKCNTMLTQPMHARACDLAKLSRCAFEKGRFESFHDAVFLSHTEERDTASLSLKDRVRDILSSNEVEACLADRRYLDQVKAEIDLGRSFRVGGTPSIYINGKPVVIPLTVENLRTLVEYELTL